MEPFKFNAKKEKATPFRFGSTPEPVKQPAREKPSAPVFSEERIVQKVLARIPTPKDGKDGVDGKDGQTPILNVKELVAEIKKLKGNERLDISDINNWNQPAKGRLDQRWHGSGSSSGAGIPGGSNTQIQFNDNGAFGGSSKMTFNKSAGGDLSLSSSNGSGAQDGGVAEFFSGDAGTTGTGGYLDIYAGYGGTASGNGGDLSITAGYPNIPSLGRGGLLQINGGSSNDGSAGRNIEIASGNGHINSVGAGDGGDILLLAGQAVSTGNGGNILIDLGEAVGSGQRGSFIFEDDNVVATRDIIIKLENNTNGSDGNTLSIIGANSHTSGNLNGGGINATAGNGHGSGAGGQLDFEGGTGGATGAGGQIYISAGYGGATSGAGGVVTVTAGSAVAGNSNGGDLYLNAGSKAGGGTKGKIFIQDGAGGQHAILDTETIASTDKVFTFPNASGTFALQGLAGTKIYYVSDSSGGTVNRKLTFSNGILTAEV